MDTRQLAHEPDAIAPDGSEVRVLCATDRGSMASFTLAPGKIARAVTHRTVEEIWYVIAGEGRLWRRLDRRQEIIALRPGASVTIPLGTHFQFRCDGTATLEIIGVTMPPWPGADEAYAVPGKWQPSV